MLPSRRPTLGLSMIEIKTDRLLLRPARVQDIDAFHPILCDARAMAFWSTPPHETLAETREWVSAMMDIDPDEGEDFVVELDRNVIGKVGFYRFPEIGFVLHPSVWGKGYATEALRPVLARAFDEHRLPSVEADVDPRNMASMQLLKRLGFEETGRATGTWQIAGKWCDSVYLTLRAGTHE